MLPSQSIARGADAKRQASQDHNAAVEVEVPRALRPLPQLQRLAWVTKKTFVPYFFPISSVVKKLGEDFVTCTNHVKESAPVFCQKCSKPLFRPIINVHFL